MKTKLIISASNKVGIVMLSKYVLCGLLLATLCFSQSIESGFDPKVREEAFAKNLSIEILGGKCFTFDHTIHFGSRTQLPFSMWRFGCRIAYQFVPNIAFSLTGGYSYAKNLTGIYSHLYLPPAFSLTNAAFLVSYKNEILGNIIYLFGSGIDVSYCRLLYNGEILSTTYLNPIISGHLRLNILSPLYLIVQGESKFHHLLKTGSEEIQQREILPYIGIGIGYTFNF